jgi:glucan phosphoethanolaminetransferase (alkaline phosphatase superfamily)
MKTLCISLIVIALLILAVQIITEIIKSVFKDKENIVYNLIVFGVSLFLTLVTVITASQIVPFKLVWYIIVGAIVGSFFIAYGAMYGYDKLFKRVFESVKNAIKSFLEIEKEVKGNEKK